MKQSGSINTSIIVHTPCFKHNRFLFYRLHFFSRYFKGYFDRIISHVNFREEKHANNMRGRQKSVEMRNLEMIILKQRSAKKLPSWFVCDSVDNFDLSTEHAPFACHWHWWIVAPNNLWVAGITEQWESTNMRSLDISYEREMKSRHNDKTGRSFRNRKRFSSFFCVALQKMKKTLGVFWARSLHSLIRDTESV